MGRTCGEPDEIKKNTHPKYITALCRDGVLVVAVHQPGLLGEGRGGERRRKVKRPGGGEEGLRGLRGPRALGRLPVLFRHRARLTAAPRRFARLCLLADKSGNAFRMGILLDFVRLSGSPHVRRVHRTCGEPNEIELAPIGVKLDGSRRTLPPFFIPPVMDHDRPFFSFFPFFSFTPLPSPFPSSYSW